MMASTGKKWLIGCGAGCLTVVLVIAGIMFGFYIWMNQPTELLEPEQLLYSDSTGHVEWTLSLEDPGTNAFMENLLAVSRDQSARDMEGLPPALRSWLLKYQGRQNDKEMRELFPLAVAWTIHPGPTPEEDVQLFSASIERLGNRLAFADWMMGFIFARTDEVEIIRHQREKIYSFPNPRGKNVTLFIKKNNIFFATDVEAAKRAIDRLQNPVESGRSAGELAALLQTGVADRPLRGAITNERGELGRLWKLLGRTDTADPIWENVRALKIAGGFEQGDRFRGRVDLRCVDHDWASDNAERLAAALSTALQHADLDMGTAVEVSGEWVSVEFELHDLPDLIKRMLRTGQIRIS
jgi:hypothetical protein